MHGVKQLFIGIVVKIPVQGQVIDIVICLFQNGKIPVAVRAVSHFICTGAAGYKFRSRVHPFHHFCCFFCFSGIFSSFQHVDLPFAVHFISQAPYFEVMGLFGSVGPSQIAPIGTFIGVAVIHKFCGLLRCSGSQVYRHQDLCPAFFCKTAKFICSDFIGFQYVPGHFFSNGAVFPGAYSILPVIAGHKISSRISDCCYTQFFYQFFYIIAETVLIRGGVSGLINTIVYTASQMFYKGTIHSPVHFSDGKIFIINNFCVFHDVCIPPMLLHIHLPERLRSGPAVPISGAGRDSVFVFLHAAEVYTGCILQSRRYCRYPPGYPFFSKKPFPI